MCVCVCVCARARVCVYIEGVSGGIVNILGGRSIDYSELISSYKHVSNFSGCEDTAV